MTETGRCSLASGDRGKRREPPTRIIQRTNQSKAKGPASWGGQCVAPPPSLPPAAATDLGGFSHKHRLPDGLFHKRNAPSPGADGGSRLLRLPF